MQVMMLSPMAVQADASLLVAEIAEALAYLHQVGVVHFDLKPENILLHAEHMEQGHPPPTGGPGGHGGQGHGGHGGHDKNREATRITDFGSAFFLNAPPSERVARAGSGTAAYMPPEVPALCWCTIRDRLSR